MNIAIIGGGPAGLFLYKRFIESRHANLTINIFEKKNKLGEGMPYSCEGANREHITNVSGNEIPKLVTTAIEWLGSQPKEKLDDYNIDATAFTEYMVLPRLLFGEYLNEQFDLLKHSAEKAGIITHVHLNTRVTNITHLHDNNKLQIEIAGKDKMKFDQVIICTGHNWPLIHEGKVPGYFDSPYPPSKLSMRVNHEVAVRGSSLTAIDAIRTLARHNGNFIEDEPHQLSFVAHEASEKFKIVMHSRQGLLPCIRFHLDDPHLSKNSLLSQDELTAHINENDGFLSLDFIFEKDFKDTFRDKDPGFHERIKDMRIEEFVEAMMELRERLDPFLLFKAEYAEAKKSIRRQESVYWKEMLAVLSFAMNYPAKHLSAEDMQRLKHVLMPLISIVIAFVPQSSCEELIALYDAGRLELVSVGEDSDIEIDSNRGIIYHYSDDEGKLQHRDYKTFIDCIGQRHLSLEDFPFKNLVKDGSVTAAKIKFRSPENVTADNKDIVAGDNNDFYLKVPGIAITNSFRVLDSQGNHNPCLHVMAVPYIGGYNPDYSGLDFCEEASKIIVDDIFYDVEAEMPKVNS